MNPSPNPSIFGSIAATKRLVGSDDPAEVETERRRVSGAVAFDNLVAANLAFVNMGRKVFIANMLVLGAVLLQSAVSIYAILK